MNQINSDISHLPDEHLQTLLCLRRPLSEDGENLGYCGVRVGQYVLTSWTVGVEEGELKLLAVLAEWRVYGGMYHWFVPLRDGEVYH